MKGRRREPTNVRRFLTTWGSLGGESSTPRSGRRGRRSQRVRQRSGPPRPEVRLSAGHSACRPASASALGIRRWCFPAAAWKVTARCRIYGSVEEVPMADDDEFTALGPPTNSSGFPQTAFSSNANGMVYGVNVQATRCGVYAESITTSTNRESRFAGVGVYAIGENVGVFGEGSSRGAAGVAGFNHWGKIGT